MILFDIDPNVVRPGWTPLLITLGLAAVLAVLYLSMRKQMRKISPDLPYEDELPGGRSGPTDPAHPTDPSGDTPVDGSRAADPGVGETHEPPAGDRPVDLRGTPGTPG